MIGRDEVIPDKILLQFIDALIKGMCRDFVKNITEGLTLRPEVYETKYKKMLSNLRINYKKYVEYRYASGLMRHMRQWLAYKSFYIGRGFQSSQSLCDSQSLERICMSAP